MTTISKTVSMLSLVALVTIAVGFTVSGQDQPARAGSADEAHRLRRLLRRPDTPSGKLVIWGDLASFDQPATAPTHCILTNRFKRGQRVGIRMTAIDGGSGEVENTAVLTAHLTLGGQDDRRAHAVARPGRLPGLGISATARPDVDGRVERACRRADRRHRLHGDRDGSIRPNRLVFAVHQRGVAVHHRRITANGRSRLPAPDSAW